MLKAAAAVFPSQGVQSMADALKILSLHLDVIAFQRLQNVNDYAAQVPSPYLDSAAHQCFYHRADVSKVLASPLDLVTL